MGLTSKDLFWRFRHVRPKCFRISLGVGIVHGSGQDLAGVVIKAIDEWLDEEIIGFEPEEG